MICLLFHIIIDFFHLSSVLTFFYSHYLLLLMEKYQLFFPRKEITESGFVPVICIKINPTFLYEFFLKPWLITVMLFFLFQFYILISVFCSVFLFFLSHWVFLRLLMDFGFTLWWVLKLIMLIKWTFFFINA